MLSFAKLRGTDDGAGRVVLDIGEPSLRCFATIMLAPGDRVAEPSPGSGYRFASCHNPSRSIAQVSVWMSGAAAARF
jgi:hypothetical protein